MSVMINQGLGRLPDEMNRGGGVTGERVRGAGGFDVDRVSQRYPTNVEMIAR